MKRHRWPLPLLLLTVLLLFSCKITLPEQYRCEIVVYGDTRTGHDVHSEVVAAIVAIEPRTVFHTGDLVDDGRVQSQWDTFNDITATMMATSDFYAALGNHERNSDLYYDNFEFPGNERWYSVDVWNVHFIILDSTGGIAVGSEQYDWLVDDLTTATNRRRHSLIAVIFHHPPYSTGKHTEDEKGLRSTVVPLFERYGVDVVFNGHDHNYERSFVDGIYYIVAGGGGAPLRDQARTRDWSQVFLKEHHFCSLKVRHKRIIVDVYDKSLNVLDHFVVHDSNPVPATTTEDKPVVFAGH